MARNQRSFCGRLRSLVARLCRPKQPDIAPAPNSAPAVAMSSASDSGASLPANGHGTAAPFICVPLYIYPAPGAWGPLVRAARARPDARFHAIVNPCNGPGADALPDVNYREAIRELASLPNVTVLGYVHVTYGKRDAAEVRRDVEKYAAWRGFDDGLRVDGVFFDEAPADVGMVGYMASVSRCARRGLRATNGTRGLVMLNPGVVVPRAYYEFADHVVAFEQALGHWKSVRSEFMEAMAGGVAAKTVVMVHSCRAGDRDLEKLACGFRDAGVLGQYVTEQMEGGYSEWSSSWDRYVGFVFAGGESC
ncbi:spherulation-specific family 4 protein [Candidatus Bathyarchaeota archaeon]|nr:spherulation-specific family 4 protein [Candidatus Bathyarchaeota archaeon]